MKIFTCAQIRKIDEYTIKNEPIKSIDLMERAAKNLFGSLIKKTDRKKNILIFAGPGNNGGDALVLARLFFEEKFRVKLFYTDFSGKFSNDFLLNMKRLKKLDNKIIFPIKSVTDFPAISKKDIVIDGLFGSGLSRPLDGLALDLVKHINSSEKSKVIAIDIPSGLFGEDNSSNNAECIIRADITYSFQFPKLAFFFPENDVFTGDWQLIPIGLHKKIIAEEKTDNFFVAPKTIKSLFPIRKKFAHKGNFGHALLIAGSYGKMGAAVLGAEACLRSGAGLLTCHLPEKGYEIMQCSLPEAMVSIDKHSEIFTSLPDLSVYSATGVGPGIGTDQKTAVALEKLFEKSVKPMVIDADALNIIGKNKKLLEKIPENSILTPHPKEFERIAGTFRDHYSRNLAQKALSVKYGVFIVLKGANSAITCPDGTCWFNTTGNPGMATAGSGDVLTGIILSLLAQGFSPEKAAVGGVYLHGLAGDIAAKKLGQESMIAGDIIENLGTAFRKIR